MIYTSLTLFNLPILINIMELERDIQSYLAWEILDDFISYPWCRYQVVTGYKKLFEGHRCRAYLILLRFYEIVHRVIHIHQY